MDPVYIIHIPSLIVQHSSVRSQFSKEKMFVFLIFYENVITITSRHLPLQSRHIAQHILLIEYLVLLKNTLLHSCSGLGMLIYIEFFNFSGHFMLFYVSFLLSLLF